MCKDICIDKCIHIRTDMCMDRCIDRCIDMCMDMCIDILRRRSVEPCSAQNVRYPRAHVGRIGSSNAYIYPHKYVYRQFTEICTTMCIDMHNDILRRRSIVAHKYTIPAHSRV